MKKKVLYVVLMAVLSVVMVLAGTVCKATPTATPLPTPTPVVVVVTATPGPSPTPGPTPTLGVPEILKIGNYGMIAGAGSPYGRASTRSVELACEDINAAGGFVVAGKRYILQPITLDSGYAVDTGRMTGERLVYTEKVKYVIGVGTANSLGIQEVTEKNKVLLFAETWTDPIIAPEKVYTFRHMMSMKYVAQGIYSYMKKHWPEKKKLFMVGADDITIKQCYEVGKPALEAMGYQIIGVENFDPKIVDWYPIVSKIKAAKPDLIEATVYGTHCGPFIKAAHELGLHQETQIIWSIGDGVKEVLKVAGAEACEGIYFTQEWDWYGKYMSDEGKAYAKRFKDRFGEEVMIHGFLAYDMVFGLVKAMQQANSLDPTVLKDIIPNLKWTSASRGKDVTLEFGDIGGRKSGMIYEQCLGQYQAGKVVNVAVIHPTKPPVE